MKNTKSNKKQADTYSKPSKKRQGEVVKETSGMTFGEALRKISKAGKPKE